MSHGILLPIDLGLKNPQLNRRIRQLAELTAGRLEQPIYPVTIVPKNQKFTVNQLEKIQQDLKRVIHPTKKVVWDNVKLIRSVGSSLQSKVDSLVEKAQEADSSYIVLGTRDLQGTFRGGFVERLIRQSPVPVVFVNPRTQVPSKIKKILFATKLLELKIDTIFKKLCEFAKPLEAEIKIVHASFPRDWSFSDQSPTDVSIDALEKFRESEKKSAAKKAQALVRFAKRQGLKASIEVTPTVYSEGKTILNVAENWNSDLIAIGAGGAATFSAHLFGSTSLTLIHHSTRPLWIFHPPK